MNFHYYATCRAETFSNYTHCELIFFSAARHSWWKFYLQSR